MKKKILLTIFLTIIILNVSVRASPLTTCEILQDTHVYEDNPTTNYGTSVNMEINRDPNARLYVQTDFENCSTNVNEIYQVQLAELCFYTGTINRDMNVSVYEVNDSNNHFGGENETTLTWNNQPCGTQLNDTSKCNFTELNTTYLDFAGQWYCFDLTNKVQEYIDNNETNLTVLISNTTSGSGGIDYFRSTEFLSTPEWIPEMNITYYPKTELNLTYDTVLNLGEYNLVQANYTLYNDTSTILNATCELTFETDSVNMSYNTTTTQYEAYVIPVVTGVNSFQVNCSVIGLEPQIQNQNATAYFLAGSPFNLSVYLWENKNATTQYIDDFAWIIMATSDLNCSLITGNNNCVFHARYKSGQANLTLYTGANYTTYYYSGELSFNDEFSLPSLNSFNDFSILGNFVIVQDQERLDLLVDVATLNFFGFIFKFATTWGVTLLLLFVSIILAIGVYVITGKSWASLLAFILLMYGWVILGWVPNFSSLLSALQI